MSKVLITGANGGFGILTVKTLLNRGHQVAASIRNAETKNKEVADELSISRKTVEVHKKAIYEKLQLKHQTDLVKYAIKHHIIEL